MMFFFFFKKKKNMMLDIKFHWKMQDSDNRVVVKASHIAPQKG